MTDVVFFDSSVVLSLLFNDKNAEAALSIWSSNCRKVASRLLHLECHVVAHRYSLRLPEKIRAAWQRDSVKWLQKTLSQLYTCEIDHSVQDVIERESALGACRTLDAVHLATCLILRGYSEDLKLATFDEKMKSAALEMKISLV